MYSTYSTVQQVAGSDKINPILIHNTAHNTFTGYVYVHMISTRAEKCPTCTVKIKPEDKSKYHGCKITAFMVLLELIVITKLGKNYSIITWQLFVCYSQNCTSRCLTSLHRQNTKERRKTNYSKILKHLDTKIFNYVFVFFT